MKNRNLLVLFVAVLIVVGTISAFVLINNQHIKYQNVKLSETCSMDIPTSNDISNYIIGNGIKIYNDYKHDTFVAYFNSQSDSSLFNSIGDAIQLTAMECSMKIRSEKITINNIDIWHNKDTGYYMASLGNNNTHDNILIVTKNKKILEHLINSIKYNENLEEDTTVSSTVSSQSSSNNNDYEDDDIDYDNDYYYDDYEYSDYESY